MSHTSELITALAVAMTSAGGGIAFLWNKIERRFTQIEVHLEACRRGRELKRTVIELLLTELKRVSPDSWVLDRAEELMAEVRDIDEEAERRGA